ncbi:MAG: ankyrin [Comamonadaceae bacterium]|nr:MAG: ankyrin [Comamonadaceae bacterium]
MLTLVLACLKDPSQFLLCGDSNQIVHPNFFSWAAVRSLFWNGLAGDVAQRQALHILQANFRNTTAVTLLANSLLKIKQARFGSVDRESNFLVHCSSGEAGEVRLMPFKDAITKQLDTVTRVSVKHAVIVLRDEDKAAARASFRTPLVFSVHEAKGLEYPHVILFNIVSGQRSAFSEVCDGVSAKDVNYQELNYRRARDKSDKSLELYKFYVNSLYVAMTRAVQSLTFVESETSHQLFALLGLNVSDAQLVVGQVSSKEQWAQEARKLELQGKQEQAQLIRDTILQFKPVPWTPWSQTIMVDFGTKALDRGNPSSKPRQALLDYALWHGQQAWIEKLAKINFLPARSLAPDGEFGWIGPHARLGFHDAEYEQQTTLAHRAVIAIRHRHLQPYVIKNFKEILRQCDVYGIDHLTLVGATPLMLAARAGNQPLVEVLIERGANPQAVDDFGHTPWQHALNRALEEPDFGKTAIGPLFDLIAPSTIDVQVDSRLVRLERHQGEYWVFSLMIAGLKTQWTRCCYRDQPPWKFAQGFFAEQLHVVLNSLPVHLWNEIRRKRSYVNQVLARGEVESEYKPSRRLWTRIQNGHYFPNPALLVRRGEDWHPIYEFFNMPWIDQGTASVNDGGASPIVTISRLQNRDSSAASEFF